ncbi:MAG TPA: TadE family protein, partial [Myxococcaceae bacterium]|nr:TadE family protein [Myxococcaceae bacterium]
MKRGQATVEMALGSIVFVTLLMLGIYLAETSYLMLKVNEAASFAMSWGTGMRVHHFSGATRPFDTTTYAPWKDVPLHTETEAGTRYADFDGVGAPKPSGIVQSLSSGTPIRVSCRADPAFEKVGVPAAPGP